MWNKTFKLPWYWHISNTHTLIQWQWEEFIIILHTLQYQYTRKRGWEACWSYWYWLSIYNASIRLAKRQGNSNCNDPASQMFFWKIKCTYSWKIPSLKQYGAQMIETMSLEKCNDNCFEHDKFLLECSREYLDDSDFMMKAINSNQYIIEIASCK